MATLGLKITLPPAATLFSSKNTLEQVAVDTRTIVVPPSGGWLTHLGLYVKYNTEAPQLALAAWIPTPAGLPGTLLARTDPVTVPPGFQGNVEAPVAWSNPIILGDRPETLRVDAGQAILLGWVVAGGDLDVGLVPAADVSVWRNNNPTGIPVNPFGVPISTLTMDPPAIYTTFQPSAAPTIALNFPVAGASLTSDAPTLTASVTDADQATYGDGVGAYEVQLREVGSPTFLVNDHVVTASAPLAGTLAYPYHGPDLVGGHSYEWAMRAQDMAGLWSGWTAFRQFSVSSVGFVDVSLGAAPAANTKVDGDSSLQDWTARWWHTAALPGNAVQVRILKQDQSILTTGPLIAQVIAGTDDPPGTLFTVNHSVAGVYPLPVGQQLYWQIAVRDSANVLSAFSTPVPFRTNAVPTVPNLISPPDGAASTDFLRLVASSVDIDADDVPLVGTVWRFEITDVRDNMVRPAFADAYDPVLGQPSFQLTTTQVPHEGRYLWRVRGEDLSAGTFGLSAYSSVQSFTYGVGPVVTVTNPGAGETQVTSRPRISWTTDDQQSAYQVRIWAVNANGSQGALLYNTGKLTLNAATTFFHDLPAGAIGNTPSGLSFDVVVSSWDEGDLQGDSVARRFLVQFGAVEGLADVQMVTIALRGDVEPSTPAISWVATRYPTGGTGDRFIQYNLYRWEIAKGRAASQVKLGVITTATQTQLRDYHAPPNTLLGYALSQTIRRADNSLVDSAEALLTTQVNLLTPTLVSTRDPEGLRFPIMALGSEWAFGGNRRSGSYQTWGAGGVPSVAEAPGMQRLRSGTFTVMGDRNPGVGSLSLRDRREAIINVIKAAGPLCLRDEYEQIFMRVADWSGRRGRIGQLLFTVQLEEIAYREGVAT